MKTGRKIVKRTYVEKYDHTEITTRTTTFGYLSDSNFSFAYKKIMSFRSNQRRAENLFFENLKTRKNLLRKAQVLGVFFKKYLDYLSKNLNKKISSEDGLKISNFYYEGYSDKFKGSFGKLKLVLEQQAKLAQQIRFQAGPDIKILDPHEAQFVLAEAGLQEQCLVITRDIAVLKKYVSTLHKLKLKFSYFAYLLRTWVADRKFSILARFK